MADEILDYVREVVEGQIDFKGQKVAETITNVSLSSFGFLSFIAGFILQDIKLALYFVLGGTAATALVVVPPWSFFKQHPLEWLPVGGEKVDAPRNLVIDENVLKR